MGKVNCGGYSGAVGWGVGVGDIYAFLCREE